MDKSLLLFCSLLMTALGNVLIPFLYSTLLAIVFSTIGFSMGVLDTGDLFYLSARKSINEIIKKNVNHT